MKKRILIKRHPRMRRFIFVVEQGGRCDYVRGTNGERKVVWYRDSQAIETRVVATADKQTDLGRQNRERAAKYLREQRSRDDVKLKAIWCC